MAVSHGVVDLGPVVATGHDGGDAPGVIAFEADRMRSVDGRDPPEIDPGRAQPLGRTGGDDPREPAPRAHRLDLRRAGRDDDLVRLDMEHPARLAGDDRRARVDPDDLDAVAGVEHERLAAVRRPRARSRHPR